MTPAQRQQVYDLLTNDLLDLTTEEIADEAGVAPSVVRHARARMREVVQTLPWALARAVAKELGWKGTPSSLMEMALMRLLAEKRRQHG